MKHISIALFSCLLFSSGCKKLVEVDPPVSALTSGSVYSNDETAASVVTGIYTDMSSSNLVTTSNIPSLSLKAGLSADEFVLFGGAANNSKDLVQYFKNELLTNNSNLTCWNICYKYLETINTAIERLTAPNGVSEDVKSNLISEAKFLRAFFHLYLVNLFGDVPLVTTSDYRVTSKLGRRSKKEVYDQIIVDLNDAIAGLKDDYLMSDAKNVYPSGSTERVRPNKWSAISLLARAYLYNNDFEKAEQQASLIISNTNLYDTVPLNEVFLKNSKEAIWQLQPVNNGWNTEDARKFKLPSSGPTTGTFPVYLSSFLLNSFEPGDKRKEKGNWINSTTVGVNTYYYPFKYKSATNGEPVTEYSMMLRLAEQYLIRAEARAQQNKIAEAQSDLNVIRKRAGLLNTTANDKLSLLAAILHERQVEFFSELGHRWIDLKRTGNVDQVMANVTPTKGGAWSTNWQWYPIPVYDILNNSNLIQNSGY